jgi:hypothetical protein
MANVRRILVITQYEMDGRNMGIVMDVTLSLYVVHLYVRIAKRRAAEGKGIVARRSTRTEEQPGIDESARLSDVDRG